MDLAAAAGDSHESAVGRLEQLADEGRSEPALCCFNDYASTGSWPTRQSDARDLELPVFSRRGTGLLVTITAHWEHHFLVAELEQLGLIICYDLSSS